MHEKDVLKCFITTSGEQCVMMDSLTQQQELLATRSDLGTFRWTDMDKRTGIVTVKC